MNARLFISLAVFALVSTSAHATSCLDKANVDSAYKGQVEAALKDAGDKVVPRTDIRATVTVEQSPHDPEYDVTLSTGKVVHVTCDDSGDDQCFCEVAK